MINSEQQRFSHKKIGSAPSPLSSSPSISPTNHTIFNGFPSTLAAMSPLSADHSPLRQTQKPNRTDVPLNRFNFSVDSLLGGSYTLFDQQSIQYINATQNGANSATSRSSSNSSFSDSSQRFPEENLLQVEDGGDFDHKLLENSRHSADLLGKPSTLSSKSPEIKVSPCPSSPSFSDNSNLGDSASSGRSSTSGTINPPQLAQPISIPSGFDSELNQLNQLHAMIAAGALPSANAMAHVSAAAVAAAASTIPPDSQRIAMDRYLNLLNANQPMVGRSETGYFPGLLARHPYLTPSAGASPSLLFTPFPINRK